MAIQSSSSNPVLAFEAGKVVFEALKDLPKPQQEQVLRWVAETLGTTSVPGSTFSPPPATPLTPTSVSPSTPGAPMDIASFVAAKQPRSDIQFVTVVAHYYRFEAPVKDRLNAITAAVAQDATRLANWDRLKAPTSTLNNARTLGYLDRTGRGEYSINTVGENLVARSMPGNAEGEPARRAVKPKVRAGKTANKGVAKPRARAKKTAKKSR
jgi:hypothetical protein